MSDDTPRTDEGPLAAGRTPGDEPGWYADPEGGPRERWWGITGWSDYYRDPVSGQMSTAVSSPDAGTSRTGAYCAQCGASTDADAQFCKVCGHRLGVGTPPPPPPAHTSPRSRLKAPTSTRGRLALVAAVALIAAAIAVPLVLVGSDDGDQHLRAATTTPATADASTPPEDTDGDGMPDSSDPEPYLADSDGNGVADADENLDDAPEAGVTDEGVSPDEPKQTYRSVGQAGVDDDLTFKVLSLREVSEIAGDEFSDSIRPSAGAKLIEAVVKIKNNGQTNADPFCGGNGAVLLDADDRNFQPHEDTVGIPNNTICGDGIAPGFKGTAYLAFEIPADAEIGGLVLWNGDAEDDSDGSIDQLVFQ